MRHLAGEFADGIVSPDFLARLGIQARQRSIRRVRPQPVAFYCRHAARTVAAPLAICAAVGHFPQLLTAGDIERHDVLRVAALALRKEETL